MVLLNAFLDIMKKIIFLYATFFITGCADPFFKIDESESGLTRIQMHNQKFYYSEKNKRIQ